MTSILSALVNGVIMSAFVPALVWVVMRFTSTRIWNAATRYALWWATLLVTLAIPVLSVAIDLRPLMRRAPAPQPGSITEAAAVPIPMDSSLPQPPARLDTPPPPSLEAPASRSVFPIQLLSGRWVEWVVYAWVAVSLLMLSRLVASCILLELRKQRATVLPAYETRLQEWLARCGSGRNGVRLAVSAEITTPVAAGPHRPCILIPARMLEALEDEELDQIGLHEAAHFSRRDDYALIFERVLEALFVFHPVLRWIAGKIDLEREMACDDVVVHLTGRPAPYASCLTRVVELAQGISTSTMAASAAEPQSHLERRIEMLLDSTRKTGTHVLKLRLAAAVAVLALMLSTASEVPNFIVLAAPPEQWSQERTEALSATLSPEPTILPSRAVPPAAEPPVAAPSESGAESSRIPLTEQAQTVSRIETPDPAFVQLQVVVTDSLQRYVSGLEKEHFKLFENGEEQDISQFFDRSALSLGIVLDVPGGDGVRQIAREAMARVLKSGSPEDEFFMTEISGALLDGVRSGLTRLQSAQNRRKALLIISNGKADPSFTADQVGTLVNTSDVSVYGISLNSMPLLDTLAVQTGGRHVAITNANDLPDVATKVGVELRHTYFLGYQPRNKSQDGMYRKVQVQVVPPKGIQQLIATSRAGYYAPVQDRGSLSTTEPTVISDTMGFNFGPYLSEISNRARASWYSRIPESARQGQKGRVVVVFMIVKDGSLRDLRVLEPSGNDALEQAPVTAIQDAAPFPVLPAGFSGDSIIVQLTFLYNER